jgi:hypothetical protein
METITLLVESGRTSSLVVTQRGKLEVIGALHHRSVVEPKDIKDAKKLITHLNAWIEHRKAQEAIPVIFRVSEGEVTAVFPTMAGSVDNRGSTCQCYAHVGQHGTCSKEWYTKTKAASLEDYSALLSELEGLYGHDALRPVKRWTIKHDIARFSGPTN